jgi:four helix bundle suffix protein
MPLAGGEYSCLNCSINTGGSGGCILSRWLDADDAVVVANAMLIIIGRSLNMLKSQIEAQSKVFEETGGFSERLTVKRIEAREKDKPPSPNCPLCGKPMRQRKSAKGNFWGCSTFPECKGTRPA